MVSSISTTSLEFLSNRTANCPFCGKEVFYFHEVEENEMHDLRPCEHVVFYYMEIAEINLFDHVNPEFAKRYLKKLKDNWESVAGEEECDLAPEIEEAFLAGSTEECCADSQICYNSELISPDLFPGAKEVHIITMDDSAQGSRPCGGMDPPWYAIGFVKKYDA